MHSNMHIHMHTHISQTQDIHTVAWTHLGSVKMYWMMAKGMTKNRPRDAKASSHDPTTNTARGGIQK